MSSEAPTRRIPRHVTSRAQNVEGGREGGGGGACLRPAGR